MFEWKYSSKILDVTPRFNLRVEVPSTHWIRGLVRHNRRYGRCGIWNSLLPPAGNVTLSPSLCRLNYRERFVSNGIFTVSGDMVRTQVAATLLPSDTKTSQYRKRCYITHKKSYVRIISQALIQGVSKRTLQWYSKCYSVASVTKTFTLKGVQTIHLSRC
jgi:hypothetical protein